MSSRATALVLAAAVSTIAGFGCSRSADAIDPTDAAVVAAGRGIYGRHCASCHGANLQGEPNWQQRKPSGRLPAPPHDASGHTWHHSDDQLFRITKFGIVAFAPPGYESDMPAFSGVLSDGEIRAVLAYVKSTWPDDIRRKQQDISSAQ